MRFTTKLFLLFAGLLGLALAATLLALWNSHQAQSNLLRSDLAHRSYQAHLSLSSHTYQLFKQFGDAMTIGDRDQGALEAELLAAIRKDLANIRKIIAAEIQLVGNEEVAELNHLAEIQNQIEKLLAEYQTVLDTGYAIPFTEEWERLSRILDERVDQDFHGLIREALAEELAELEVQQATARARLRASRLLAISIALFGAVAAAFAFWWLVRDLKAPVAQLIAGAEAIGGGDREHRIPRLRGSELNNVAIAFNRMADEIMSRTRALEASNERLEQAVAARTAELERLLTRLKAADAERIRLLADVSHELRTPLTVIRGEADIALRGGTKPAEAYREALEKARDAAEHTSRLVDDLLFVARREAGQARLKLETVDLADLLSAVFDSYRSLAQDNAASISYFSELPSAPVRADPNRLRQVLVILIDNAARYGSGQIDVRLGTSPKGYAILVSNDGPGLSKAEVERVFQRFYRGSDAARRYKHGAGLGLPVAKAIVEAHSGEITIASEPGEGVTVAVILPARRRLELVS